MSAILDFYDLYQFKTYMNGVPDLKSPNFDTKHEFLSSIGAEIISFLLKKAAIFILRHFWSIPYFFKVAPHPNLMDRTLRLGSRSVVVLSAL